MNHYMRMVAGQTQPPPVFDLLQGKIMQTSPDVGLLRANYQASNQFLNPAGTVQGGMLCAMLDDLTAGLVDSTLDKGQGVVTLGMNVSFLRPALTGTLEGEARLTRRGRDIHHVQATLFQNGKEVACATAICKVIALT